MGFLVKRKRKREETVTANVTDNIAAYKARQNIYIQKNKSIHTPNRVIRNKNLSLFSFRVDAGLV